jgi:Tol biopolymer transport system component
MNSDQPSPESPLAAEQLTYYEGIESEAGFSPDGNQVVFTWNGENQDNFDVYVKTVGGPRLHRLTQHPDRDFSPAWSPDGQWIAFLRETGDGRNGVYRIPALGGREERLSEVMAAPREYGRLSVNDRFLCWSPDSEFLVVVDQQSADEGSSLFLLSPGTGRTARLTSAPQGGLGDRSPAFSPDGRILSFVRSLAGVSSVWLLSLGADLSPAGDPQRLTPPNRMCFGPSWGRDSSEILLSAERNRPQLWAVSLKSPNTMQRLEFAGAEGYLPATSQTAQRLVYTRGGVEANVWQLDLRGDSAKTTPGKVISSTGWNSNFQFSPDGTQIAFASDRSGQRGVWISNADGTEQAPLGPPGGGTPRWSPAGATIAFDSQTSGGDYDIWNIRVQGGAPERLTRGEADDRVPNWSRDGQWVYFASDRGGGHQLWKKALRSGEEEQITHHGGFHAFESQDGFLYYTKALADWSVWRVPLVGGKEEQVLKPVSSWTNFALTERGIYFSPGPGPDVKSLILFYDFSNGSTTEVFRPAKPLSVGLAVSPDGRHLLYSQIDREGSDLMLVENFR